MIFPRQDTLGSLGICVRAVVPGTGMMKKSTADSPTLERSMLLACIKLLDRAQHIFTPHMLTVSLGVLTCGGEICIF